MFRERFEKILSDKQITMYKLSKDTGIPSSLLSNYKNGKRTPSSENIIKISKYLEVSADYLLGRTDDPNQKPGDINVKFDEFTYAYYNETKDLTDKQKQNMLEMARLFKKTLMDEGKIPKEKGEE